MKRQYVACTALKLLSKLLSKTGATRPNLTLQMFNARPAAMLAGSNTGSNQICMDQTWTCGPYKKQHGHVYWTSRSSLNCQRYGHLAHPWPVRQAVQRHVDGPGRQPAFVQFQQTLIALHKKVSAHHAVYRMQALQNIPAWRLNAKSALQGSSAYEKLRECSDAAVAHVTVHPFSIRVRVPACLE